MLGAHSRAGDFEGFAMRFAQRFSGIVPRLAVVVGLAAPLLVSASSADARVGGGGSFGSRGTRTFSAPPSTSTAPSAAQPFNRTMTQPGSPGMGTAGAGGGAQGGLFQPPPP